MGRVEAFGMWVPSLPLVMRRRCTEVFEDFASCVYRSDELPVEGRESSSGSFLTGFP